MRWDFHGLIVEGLWEDEAIGERWLATFASRPRLDSRPDLSFRLALSAEMPPAPPAPPDFQQGELLAYYVSGPQVTVHFPRFGQLHLDLACSTTTGVITPKALAAYGVPGYQVRAYPSLAAEIQDATLALAATHEPVVLIAWYGAHTWVMTGYRASADPALFRDAAITGAYILDPWYPRVSKIWGRSAPPGAFHTTANLAVNLLPWKRPEGRYPARDGKYIAVVPTMPASALTPATP